MKIIFLHILFCCFHMGKVLAQRKVLRKKMHQHCSQQFQYRHKTIHRVYLFFPQVIKFARCFFPSASSKTIILPNHHTARCQNNSKNNKVWYFNGVFFCGIVIQFQVVCGSQRRKKPIPVR